MNLLFSLLAGTVFGLGLIVSGMANPEKVLGFFDLFGSWDPSLAFVMAGAVAVGVVGFAIAGRRAVSLLGFDMKLPKARHLDRRLVVGSLLFGAGWGIAGLCPGPALVGLGTATPQAVTFVLAMLAGMVLFELIEVLRGRQPVPARAR